MRRGTGARAQTAETAEPSVNAEAADAAAAAEWAHALIHGRRTVLPKRLAAPGPNAEQLELILSAASAAPDHGELLPWRFVIIPEAGRPCLAEVFAASLRERDAGASEEDLARAREKAYRAPLLLLAIARVVDERTDIPANERLISAGCAIQNMLLMAGALGFASALTSGKALQSQALRQLFSLSAQEQALCFISLGTAASAKPRRERARVQDYVSQLGPHS